MAKPQSRNNQSHQKPAPTQPAESLAVKHSVDEEQLNTQPTLAAAAVADAITQVSDQPQLDLPAGQETKPAIEEDIQMYTVPELLQLTEEEMSWFPVEVVETYLVTAADYQVVDEPRRFSLRGLLMYRTLNASMKDFVSLLHDKLDTVAAYEHENPRWFNPEYVHPEKSAKADTTPSQQSKEVEMSTENKTPATNLTVNKETIDAFRALAKDLGGSLVPEDSLAKALAERVDQTKLNAYVDSMTTLAQKAEANIDGKWTRRAKNVTFLTATAGVAALAGWQIGLKVREFLDNRDAAEA